jgi:metallo-beta-lactamase family protein
MNLTFLGATRTVTGSKFLLEADGRRILFDCGLFQGLRELRQRNRAEFPVEPSSIDAVVLTHAHLDHSGYLPLLVRNGFEGRVYVTPATADLCRILLPDSGYLQEEEAARANRKGYTKHDPALPLYTRLDAITSLASFEPIRFEETFDLGGGLSARFDYAGHILGAAIVTVTNGTRTVVFSGDLGRPHDPLLFPPAVVRHADYLLIESTYGDRDHIDEDPIDQFADVIRRTVARGGTIVIPSFAVGRAQLLMHYVDRMMRETMIPDVPVYLDSPMAVNATDVYSLYARNHKLTPAECDRIFGAVRIANTVAESKAIDASSAPKIIISASGMATGGRVLHHIHRFAQDHRNTILFVGYQAAGTRGATMIGGAKEVRMFGRMVPIEADIEMLDGLSAHVDYGEMLDWLAKFEAPPRRTFLVHGEPDAADALHRRITERLGWNCHSPAYNERVALG